VSVALNVAHAPDRLSAKLFAALPGRTHRAAGVEELDGAQGRRLIVGGGKRIFPTDGTARPLQLVDSQVTTGAVLATYSSTEA
jgi:hypothetical protein